MISLKGVFIVPGFAVVLFLHIPFEAFDNEFKLLSDAPYFPTQKYSYL